MLGATRKSIGTNTSWVGIAKPIPTSKRTREAKAYATIRVTTRNGEVPREEPAKSASGTAIARKPAAAMVETTKSRLTRRVEARSRDASISSTASSSGAGKTARADVCAAVVAT